MMGSFISRILIMVLGYAYPAYECFKEVEKNIPEIEQLLFWCHYWILVASFSFFERFGDNLIAWLPMYGEAKLAFLIYLWHPKTKGSGYVYNCFVRPFLAKQAPEIDRNLSELKLNFWRYALFYWQIVSSYGQSKFFEILKNVSSLSSSQQVATNQKDRRITTTSEQERSPEGDRELESETKQSDLHQQEEEEAVMDSAKQIPGLWRLFQTNKSNH